VCASPEVVQYTDGIRPPHEVSQTLLTLKEKYTFLHNHWTEFYEHGVLPEVRSNARMMAVGSGASVLVRPGWYGLVCITDRGSLGARVVRDYRIDLEYASSLNISVERQGIHVAWLDVCGEILHCVQWSELVLNLNLTTSNPFVGVWS
jgi:hypothetical protein